MRKLVIALLSSTMFISGCGRSSKAEEQHQINEEVDHSETMTPNNDVENIDENTVEMTETTVNPAEANEEILFNSLNDNDLLTYMEDGVYKSLISDLDSTEYFVDNITVQYLSKEYIEALNANSQENIYFGLTQSQLEEQFQGQPYIFTLGKNGQTTVVPYGEYKDPYNTICKNVMIGTGVILICVTVSVVSAGAGAPAVSMIFAASAKTGTIMALQQGVIGGVAAGIVKGFQTHDYHQALEAAALGASDSFKMGAIAGALVGGIVETSELYEISKATKAVHGDPLGGLSLDEAAIVQKEKMFDLDIVKNLHSMEEYTLYKDAGLEGGTINGRSALIKEIDWTALDSDGLTNAQRVIKGLSPLGPDGYAYELHHIGQLPDSPLAILTKTEHMMGGNNKILHFRDISEVSHDPAWQKLVKEFWKELAKAQGVII